MIGGFERLVGWRYTRGGRHVDGRDGFISFIAVLAVTGIALGVAALIVVLSVVNGFQREVRDRMLSVVSHIELLPRAPDRDWRLLADRAAENPRIIGAAPFVAGQVVISHDEKMRGAGVRGIDPAAEAGVSGIAGEMTAGELSALTPGSARVVLGSALAANLGVGVGGRISLITPRPPAAAALGGRAAPSSAATSQAAPSPTSATFVPQVGRYEVAGLFESGHYDYDSTLVLMNVDDARQYFGPRGIEGLRLRVDNPDLAPQVAGELQRRLGNQVGVRDWSAENRIWFASVQVQKRMLALILALIIGVAAFNLVAMLVMVVTDKGPDIAILRTLGARPGSILAIFMIQGAIIGFIGTAVGTLLGVVLALNVGRIVGFVEAVAGIKVLDPAVYLLSELPSEVLPHEVLAIAAVSLVLALIATVYPSLRAAAVRPAEALRHE